MQLFQSVIIINFVFISSVISRELPSFIPVCKRSRSDFNSCMMKATVTLRPYIAKGIKELGIPAVEPLEIPMVKLEQGTGSVNYKASLTNIKIYGLSNYHFRTFTTDISKMYVMHGNVDLPSIKLVSDYVISGRVLVVPIQGNGIFTANITNCKADITTQLQKLKRKGVDYLTTKDTDINLQIGGAMAHFGNLFNGDSILSETTNTFLNQNAKDIIEEVKPAIEAVASMLLEDITSKILRSQPFDKLFPE